MLKVSGFKVDQFTRIYAVSLNLLHGLMFTHKFYVIVLIWVNTTEAAWNNTKSTHLLI